MDCAPLTDAAMRDAGHYDDRQSVKSDDSDSGSSSSSTDSWDSFFEKSDSDESSSGTPPSSPNKTKPCTTSASPPSPLLPPPGAYLYPSGRTVLRLPAPRYTAPVRVRTHLFKSTANPAPGETIQTQTPLDGDFTSFLLSPGTVWVDKLPFVYSLCPLIPSHHKLALVRRPTGLGHTAFLVAAMLAFDSFSPHVFRDLFGTSPTLRLNTSTPQLNTVTLNLDMGLAFDYSMSLGMQYRINQYMNRQLQIILLQVGDSLQLTPGDVESYFDQDSRKTFQNLIDLLRGAVKMVILIEDLNWSLIRSTPDDAFEAAFLLDAYVVRPIREALEQECVAGGILLGRPVEDEPAWVHSAYKGDALFTPIACDITHDKRVRGAFGFSLPEVTSLAEELLEDVDVRLSFLDEVKASEPAYRHEDYVEYSMNDVLGRLRQRTGQPGPDEEEFYYFNESDSDDDDEDVEMEEVENVLRILE